MAALFAAIGVSALAMTPTAGTQQPAAGAGPGQVDKGKTTYAENCSHCHGPNMVNPGTITPDLREFPDDKALFFNTVKHGRNGKMPLWGDLLSDQQIADIWAYVSSRRNP